MAQQSTSPLYALIASNEIGAAMMEGPSGLALTREVIDEAVRFRQSLERAHTSFATAGDWFTCFPGIGLLTADDPGAPAPDAGPAVSAECGELVAGAGVRLRWPDGEQTEAVTAGVTGMGRAGSPVHHPEEIR